MNVTSQDVLAGVGPRLHALRQARNISLAALAAETGLTASTLSRLENGKLRPTLEQLLPLARAHGVPLDELVAAPPTGDPRIHLRPVRRSGFTVVDYDTIYTQNSPANRFINSATRSWTDTNKNLVVDCDILNPAMQVTPGGDTCGALTGNALNFGKAGNNLTQVNPEILEGWGVRRYDWQWGLSLQQELLPRVSMDVEYNRRSFGNYTVTDNRSLAPSDYQPWTINAPVDSRLPEGGGYPIEMYTPSAAAGALAAQNYVTSETDFGPARTHYWHGVDLTLRARVAGVTLQGGTSTGRTIIDTCATEVNIDSPSPRFCHNEEPFQTTLRGLASYTIPKVDVLISGTVRSQPPAPLNATWNVPNTVVQTLLGRLPPGALATGNTAVALLDNDGKRLYADNRRTQVDMRFAKILRFGRTRTDIGVDLYNLLNTNYALTYESNYSYTQPNGGTWQNPTSILAPRFARFNITVNY